MFCLRPTPSTSSIIIHPIWLTPSIGCLLSAGQVTHFSPPSHPLTKTSKGNSSNFLLSPRVGSSFLTSSGSPDSPCIEPKPLLASSNGLVRLPMSRSGRSMPCSIASREGFLPESSYLYISHPSDGVIFRVCLFTLLLHFSVVIFC